MRQIKFRAWDKEKKCWLSFDEDDPIGEDYELKEDAKGWYMFFDFDKERVALMQFTGLLDKNGKEIFEGDVVTCDCYPFIDKGKPNYNATVEWIFSQWQLVLHCVNPEKSGISDGINSGLNDDGIEEGEKTDLEVIGNIYENPELLTP